MGGRKKRGEREKEGGGGEGMGERLRGKEEMRKGNGEERGRRKRRGKRKNGMLSQDAIPTRTPTWRFEV